jgi:histidinol phosphatase-like enzyme
VLKAQKEFDLDLHKCYMIGDSLSDIQTGKAVACRSFMIGTFKCDLCRLMDETGVKPDLIFSDLYQAAKQIAKEVNKTR